MNTNPDPEGKQGDEPRRPATGQKESLSPASPATALQCFSKEGKRALQEACSMESEYQEGCRPCSGTVAAEAAKRASELGKYPLTLPLQPGASVPAALTFAKSFSFSQGWSSMGKICISLYSNWRGSLLKYFNWKLVGSVLCLLGLIMCLLILKEQNRNML